MNESSRHTDTEKADSCNTSFLFYQTKPSRRDNHCCAAFIVSDCLLLALKEYDLEWTHEHKGFIMPNIFTVDGLFIQASFLLLLFFFKDCSSLIFAVVDCVDLKFLVATK